MTSEIPQPQPRPPAPPTPPRNENPAPATIRVEAPDPFDFHLTVGYQTNYRGRAGSDLLADGVYYRALWMPDAPRVIAIRPAPSGNAVEVSLPNGANGAAPDGALQRAAHRAARILGFDIPLDGFYRLLANDPVLSAAVGPLRGLRLARAESLYEAIVHAIAGQQISGAVARVIRDGLVTTYGVPLDADGHTVYAFPQPETIAQAGPDALRALKLSARKAEYIVGISQRAIDGELDDARLDLLPDEEIIARLAAIRGVGRWTAQWAVMRALGRVDVLPSGDLALQRAVGSLYFDGRRLPDRELDAFAAEQWRPYRGLATAYLFAHIRRQRALAS